MAGTLNLTGMADGLLAGQISIGPSTVSGSEAISELITVTLAANVAHSVVVPAAAVQWAVVFAQVSLGSAAPEVKWWTNHDSEPGVTVAAQGFISNSFSSSTTELKFKSASPPAGFQIYFI